jgi:futalosine hydrolase
VILLAAATAQEVAFLTPRSDLDVLVTGIGPVEAAARVAQRLAQRSYDLVVNAGIAGAYARRLHIGDGLIVWEERLELDLETTAPLTLPEGLHVEDRARSDATLVERLVAKGVRVGRGVTVTRVTATDETAARLRAQGADVESMEGFAVLRTAAIAGVPAIELRGISNYAGARARSEWSFAVGVHGLARVLDELLALQ